MRTSGSVPLFLQDQSPSPRSFACRLWPHVVSAVGLIGRLPVRPVVRLPVRLVFLLHVRLLGRRSIRPIGRLSDRLLGRLSDRLLCILFDFYLSRLQVCSRLFRGILGEQVSDLLAWVPIPSSVG